MVTESKLVMLLFAILMVIASFAMINKEENTLEAKEKKDNNKTVKLLAFGIGIGFATGILGAGGGFLLIPTLVILMGMHRIGEIAALCKEYGKGEISAAVIQNGTMKNQKIGISTAEDLENLAKK